MEIRRSSNSMNNKVPLQNEAAILWTIILIGMHSIECRPHNKNSALNIAEYQIEYSQR